MSDYDYEKADCIDCGSCENKCKLGLFPKELVALYNEFLDGKEEEVKAKVAALPEAQHPSKCFGCGTCQLYCPQKIEIWKVNGALAKMVKE